MRWQASCSYTVRQRGSLRRRRGVLSSSGRRGHALGTYNSAMPRILDLRLDLLDVTPRPWRGLRVPADLGLDDLHKAIQTVMGWEDRHLHVFEVGDREYGPRPDDDFGDTESWAGEDSAITIAEACARGSGRIEYVYDFGDEWRLEVRVTAETSAPGSPRLECLAGALAGPPEDSGGPGAYQDILDAWLKTGRQGLPKEIRDWLPKGFDATRFDVEAVNSSLRAAFREKASPEFPAGPTATPNEHLLAELTLLVLYLGSAQERHGLRRAWKTMRFEILDALQEAGLIDTSPQRKSVLLTEGGVERAEGLRKRVASVLAAPTR